ncbi:uncharacterized protein LOC129975587 [Argiope bruennichi]|uniref:uncharacterized protein LOC129975587 n=1 Tax=Argiope bruennichi TaxID=94029 RepID=UPI002493DB23|nr:uncharacterized protein LOC129975587 [Argiope bruennichi]
MDKLTKIIEKRSSVRSSVTKLLKRAHVALEEEKEKSDLNTLEEILELLGTKEEILKQYNQEVEDLITDPEKFKSELKGSEEYEDKILTVKIKLRGHLKQVTVNTSAQESNSSLNKSINAVSALKLPKLEIPRFSGDTNFMEFLNCYNSAIGYNDSLTKIEKFQYLKSLLSPPAYNVVAGFELNEKNYDSCIELLNQRYGRKDFIINSYMSRLLNLEPVRNSSHVKGLRRLYDDIEINIRNLKSLDVTEGSYGHLLNPLLLKLLPQDLVLDFHRKRSKDNNCEASEIMDFLRNEVESREIYDSILSELKTKNIQLADSFDKGVPVEIIVGSDSFWEVVYDQRERVCQNTWVINSVFGWLIGGVGKRDDSTESCENVCLVMDSSSILFELNKFWEIEEFPNEIRGLSERDDHLIKTFENNLKFNGKRYVCKLMWKDNMGPPVELDSNFEVAERRFNSLERKLNKNPEIADQYKKIVKDQLECDIVGKCVYKDTRTGYYMPHRAVIRDDKATTQVRIVYDCSSKGGENKKSLNDSLETGVNLNANLLDVILKFRENQIAFCGDLVKAFLMIEIAEEDRKYLKFLWFPEDTGGSKQVFNFNRLPFGLTTSPFALACVLKFHIRKFIDKYPKCCEMLNSLYVDDLYYGADTAQDAYQLTSSAIDILRSAGFNLRKLRTNCVELNELWFENGYKGNTDHGQGSGFLGLNWDPIEDEIKLNLKDVWNSLEFGITNGTSKRHELRVISQIFDPCGLISPFVITVKILIQELWKRSLEWDEQLPQDLEEKWNTWCSELSAIDNLRIERKLFTKLRTNDISLHIFCDASPKAYGAVAYFRYITEEGSAKVSFIMSKSKVAPLKTLTLARLELMAALIGARLAKYLQDTFPSLIKRVYLWSDSKIVIHWVKGSAKIWKPFVCNRVTQVQLLTSPLCWNHCSGSENPADLTTRGESAKAFLSSSLWWTGPEWLSRPVHSWPVQCSSILSDSICDKEIFSSERRRTETVNTMVVTTNVDDCISSCINIDKYSNLRKLLRVTAFVKRFMSNSKPRSLKFSGPLSAFELQEALHSWIKATQIKYFGAEIHQLLSKSVISKDSCVYNLSPELDENNLLQLKGRLQFFSGDMRAKHPWLLPSNDKFVKLLILDAHFKMGHLGVEGTLTHLSEQFWIIKGRQFVKKGIE